MDYLAKIDAVAQQVKQGTTAERLAAEGPALRARPPLRLDTLRCEFALESMHRAEIEIARKDVPDRLCLCLVHAQNARAFGG